ncbi:MAG TPA: hypothetical protein VN029_11790, partial [Sphingomonas sp.]|nr:hypothetical protein [Sphingomonas sp.]
MAVARTGDDGAAGSVAAYRWATCLLAFALLPPTLVLLGWIFRIPVLRGLGNPHYSIAPLITWLFLLIAIAAVLAHRRMPRSARGVVALPLVLLLLLAIQYAVRFDLGLERLMFADQLVPLHVVNRGVPGLGAVAV